MMSKSMKERVILVLLVVATSVLMWLPFLLRIESLPLWEVDFSSGMETVFANFDGPNYLIIAKTWYSKDLIRSMFSNPLPLEYYPAHLPLYPAIVWLFDLLLPGTWALLTSSLLGSIFAYLMFYQLLKEFKLSKHALWLCAVFLVLPARWVAVRNVGSPEGWFIGLLLLSILFFKKEKFWLAGITGALAQLTKSPGILLFGGYGLYFLLEAWNKKKIDVKLWLKAAPLALIPLVVIPMFYLYETRTGDFWAYFNSGDNFHLFLPPFSIFSPKGAFWTGDFWLEEVIWVWLIYGIGVVRLFNKKLKVMGSFALVFWVSTLFVAHRDLARYILPIAPLALIGWDEELQKKEFRWIKLALIIPVVLYAWNYMLHNIAPVADWTPYL